MQTATDAGSQINGVIDHLAAKLSVPASQLWGVLLRQAKLEGYMDLGFTAVFLAGGVLLALLTRHAIRECADNSWSEWEIGGVFAGISAAVMLILALVCLHSAVTELANPAYFAAQAILGGVK
jgi:uncharacterized membrane-anchored protein